MKNFTAPDLRSCYDCKFFESGSYDSDTGASEPTLCGASAQLFDQGDCTEQTALMFEAILFQLSALNNCPLRTEKSQTPRRSIVDLKTRNPQVSI